ncbi:tail fiber domain-containing protein [Thiolapillus sp.]
MKKQGLILAILLTGVSGLAMAAESFYVTAGGDVGIGTNDPQAALHIVRDDATGETTELLLENSDEVKLGLLNTATGLEWVIGNGLKFSISQNGVGMDMDANGNMTVTGTVTANNVVLTSDRNAKTAFEDIDSQSILDRLQQVPVSAWSYKSSPDQRHIGPMAQDFYAAFGLGGSDKRISMVDAAGVALAAIKALNQRLQEKEARIAELEERLARQEDLAARVQALEAVTVKLIQERKPALRTATLRQR